MLELGAGMTYQDIDRRLATRRSMRTHHARPPRANRSRTPKPFGRASERALKPRSSLAFDIELESERRSPLGGPQTGRHQVALPKGLSGDLSL